MSFQCFPCDRPLKDQQALDQHIRDSAIHKKCIPRPAQVWVPTTLQSAAFKTSIYSPRQPTYLQQLYTAASRSSSSQITNYGQNGTYHDKKGHWSVIPIFQQPAVLEALQIHCHSPEDLLKNKYLLCPYTTQDLAGFRKCINCGGLQKNMRNRTRLECKFHITREQVMNRSTQRKEFSCCRTSSAGCTTLPTHNYAHLDPRLGAKYRSFAPTPAASPQKLAFRAVTLDCEMAGVAGMMNEVILICAADYFTGAILLNTLVCPAEKVTSWRTSIHGIKRSAMETAVLQGQALAGWKDARQELWKLIDDTTILVGHALQHDLDVLRMIHPRIVDSAMLASNAVGTRVRQWGLKTLCQEFLSIEMRNNKGEVHDCMEDVLATREVVLWCTRNRQDLEHWANLKRMEEEFKVEERLKAQQAEENEKAKKTSKAKNPDLEAYGKYTDAGSKDDEIIFWSDVAEDLGYPNPDTGYDPWSD